MATVTWSNGSLTTGVTTGMKASTGINDKKRYFEIKVESSASIANLVVGICGNDYTPSYSTSYTSLSVRMYGGTGEKATPRTTYGATYAVNDIISVLVDFDNGTVEFWKNGVSQGIAFTTLPSLTKPIFAFVSSGNTSSHSYTANFGASQFIYKMPKGYYSYDGNQTSMYKTFILHNGKYKKYIPYKSESIASLSGDITGGKTYTSSSSYSASYTADKAFNDSVAFNGTYTTDGWMGSSTVNDWVKVDLGVSKRIGKVTLVQLGMNGVYYRCGDFKIEYSNDNVVWNVAYQGTMANNYNIQEFTFDSTGRYWRLYILSNQNGVCGIAEMELMEALTFTGETQESLSDFSSTLPTVDQFISDGISDLSVLDRKPKTETIVMNDDVNGGTGEVLGSGKVFKEKIDLNKYFDITGLNIV